MYRANAIPNANAGSEPTGPINGFAMMTVVAMMMITTLWGRNRTTRRPLLCSVALAYLFGTNAFVPVTRSNGLLSLSQSNQHRQPQQRQWHGRFLGASAGSSRSDNDKDNERTYNHTLAILAMPSTSIDRIVNDALLMAAVASSRKLSVVLRCEGRDPPTIASLRRYVGEIYSQLWDCAMEQSEDFMDLDVVVYPQNLPNAAPESWIDIQPDLDCVCSHDALCGWVSEDASGRGTQFQKSGGMGGVEAHVAALNRERTSRGLKPVEALSVQLNEPLLDDASLDTVIFMEDEDGIKSNVEYQIHRNRSAKDSSNNDDDDNDDDDDAAFLSGARASRERSQLFDYVTVGGTFDGLHFGHRKLLTLAVSSVTPVTGRLMVGVTVDAMLTRKSYAEYIPKLEERMERVREFLHRLAPGMMK